VKNKQGKNPATKRNTNIVKSRMSKKDILIIAQIVISIVSVSVSGSVIWKTNTLTNTANLLQLNNAIQVKTDVFYSVELKRKEMELTLKNGGTIDDNQTQLIHEERLNALASLLNIYEFACQQYISNKIDRKAFKLFYDVMIKYIMTNYIHDKELHPAIYKVYTEWYGK